MWGVTKKKSGWNISVEKIRCISFTLVVCRHPFCGKFMLDLHFTSRSCLLYFAHHFVYDVVGVVSIKKTIFNDSSSCRSFRFVAVVDVVVESARGEMLNSRACQLDAFKLCIYFSHRIPFSPKIEWMIGRRTAKREIFDSDLAGSFLCLSSRTKINKVSIFLPFPSICCPLRGSTFTLKDVLYNEIVCTMRQMDGVRDVEKHNPKRQHREEKKVNKAEGMKRLAWPHSTDGHYFALFMFNLVVLNFHPSTVCSSVVY